MTYRDPAASLRARRDKLASDLDEARRAAREAAEKAASVTSIENEIAQVDALLAGVAKRRGLPLLEDVRVASPCNASWDEMTGDERARFCGHCAKHVYNLSAMTRDEAERLLADREGVSMCVRLHKRADGTVLTADCPVGARRKRIRRAAIAALAAVGSGVMAAMTLGGRATQGEVGQVQGAAIANRPEPRAVMGDIEVEPTTTAMGSVAPTPPPPPKPVVSPREKPQVMMGRR